MVNAKKKTQFCVTIGMKMFLEISETTVDTGYLGITGRMLEMG